MWKVIPEYCLIVFILFLFRSVGVSWSQWFNPLLNFVKDFYKVVQSFLMQFFLCHSIKEREKPPVKDKHTGTDRYMRTNSQDRRQRFRLKTDGQEWQKTKGEKSREFQSGLSLPQVIPRELIVYPQCDIHALILTLSLLLTCSSVVVKNKTHCDGFPHAHTWAVTLLLVLALGHRN